MLIANPDKSINALWGKLACEILMQRCVFVEFLLVFVGFLLGVFVGGGVLVYFLFFGIFLTIYFFLSFSFSFFFIGGKMPSLT